jgi:Family of unknown function (DUF5715)/LysM domain
MPGQDAPPTRSRRLPCAALAVAASVVAFSPGLALAQSLVGSKASLDRQNRIAREHDFTYIQTPARVRWFVDHGYLVKVEPNSDFTLHGVSFPYARPEVAMFVRRLAGEYRRACGEKLVVTSLTRPTTRQPSNASDRSVHPTGMAVDLRYSRNKTCRAWLEGVLESLEATRVLEATREHYPVHYHVAVFPDEYAAYVDHIEAQHAAAAQDLLAYKVKTGDSLWAIAHSHGITVDALRAVNQLDSSRIYAGQVIDVPAG